MPPVAHTIIQPNHAKKPTEIAIIRENFMEEVALGRMIGPLSIKEAEAQLGSPFRTSPLGLVPKAGAPGKYRVIRDLSHTGDAPCSVNDYIDADRPTRWVGFDEFAKMVSILPLPFPAPSQPAHSTGCCTCNGASSTGCRSIRSSAPADALFSTLSTG